MAHHQTQRTQREDNFSFAVERTAKENYLAALLHNNLTLMHYYYSLPYHCEVLQNAQKGWFLLFSVLSTESNKKNNLCVLCVLSEAGGELLQCF